MYIVREGQSVRYSAIMQRKREIKKDTSWLNEGNRDIHSSKHGKTERD